MVKCQIDFSFFVAYFIQNHQSSRYGGHEAGPARVIADVQHGEAIGVNSMTERFSPPEELISQECDGQAIIATGTFLSSLGQLAGCSGEYKHDTVATSTTYFAAFFRGKPLSTEAFLEALNTNCS